MSTISEQIQKLQAEADAATLKLQDETNKKIAKLTAGAEKELLATLTTAAEAFTALPEPRRLELWKEETFDGVLTTLKLQSIKPKPPGRRKGASRPGKPIGKFIDANSPTTVTAIVAATELSSETVKGWLNDPKKNKKYTINGEKVSKK